MADYSSVLGTENGVLPSCSDGGALCGPVLQVTYRPPFWLCSEPGLPFHLPESCERSPRAGWCQGCPLWVFSLPLALARESLTVLPALTPTHTVPTHPRGLCVSESASPPQNRPAAWPHLQAHAPFDKYLFFFFAPFFMCVICSHFIFKIHL